MFYDLFLTVHIPTHNAFCYLHVHKVAVHRYEVLSRRYLERSSEDRLPSPHNICTRSKTPSCTDVLLYHSVTATELTTKRGCQGHSQPDVSWRGDVPGGAFMTFYLVIFMPFWTNCTSLFFCLSSQMGHRLFTVYILLAKQWAEACPPHPFRGRGRGVSEAVWGSSNPWPV
jgi:hypothetical protein